jgi:small subunit ribosomal protein S8e
MSYFQGRDNKKPTGGRLRASREKRRFELGSAPIETTMASNEDIKKTTRGYGGSLKVRLDEAKYINVINPKTNTSKKVKLLKVKDNPSNVDYARRGVITKGALVETEMGDVKISSRPGQECNLNGILLSK